MAFKFGDIPLIAAIISTALLLLLLAIALVYILRARNQLKESRNVYQTALNNVDALIYLKDTSGKYIYVNQPICDLLGYSREEIVGQDDNFFFCGDTVEMLRRNDVRVLRHGETIRIDENNLAFKQGIRRIYRSTKLPLRDSNSNIYALCGISIDITEQKKFEDGLQLNEQRLKLAGEVSYDLLYEWDAGMLQMTWLGDVDSILGFAPGEISRHFDLWLARVHPDDLHNIETAIEQCRQSKSQVICEYRIQHKDGHYLYWKDHAMPLIDEKTHINRWVGVCTDITQQKQQEAKLHAFALSDPLTGLPNRVALSEHLRKAITTDTQSKKNVAVLYIDLDGFKAINDKHGHECGDKLLTTLSKRFAAGLKEGDTISRFGGDEFVAVLLDIEHLEDAIPSILYLLNAASKPVNINHELLKVSASLGATLYCKGEGAEVDGDQLIRQADHAMYQAKLLGKNRYAFFDTQLERNLKDQHQTIQRIQQAIENDELVLHYQPKVNMRTGEVIGCEALIRWNHPEQGLLLPGKFLPAIEDTEMSAELDVWVLKRAMRQIEEWNAQGHHLCVSINIAGALLHREGFIKFLKQQLEKHPDIKPFQIELEVLEHSALQDIELISEIMRESTDAGIRFALDDFGTGYSSLTYLKMLPASVIKIDRSFIKDMVNKPDDRAILNGIIGMANAFGREVVAEGVEDPKQGEMLMEFGCDLAQGFLIARPMAADLLPTWIEEWQVPEEWSN